MSLLGSCSSTLSFDSAEIRPLTDADLEFLLSWLALPPAGESITDAEKESLRQHIVQVWRETKAIAHVYRCVQTLSFLTPRARKHPRYASLLEGARAKGADFRVLDIGAAFGQDDRALIVDGVPPASITAVDVTDAYWSAGARLFDAVPGHPTHALDGVHFIRGDWASPRAAAGEADVASAFFGKVDVALCMFVLHVLSKAQVSALLARISACLLPGGLLIGVAAGALSPIEWALTPDGSAPRWLHSAASLREELVAAGFDNIDVVEDTRQWEEGAPMPTAAAAGTSTSSTSSSSNSSSASSSSSSSSNGDINSGSAGTSGARASSSPIRLQFCATRRACAKY